MSFLFNFWKKKKILPDVAIFEITFRCPYRCPFCYCPWENASAGEYPRSELSTGELKDALKMLKSCGVGQVTFSGGEPTSRSDFREILLYTRRELKLKVGIISNGYLIDEDFLDFIRPLKILLSLSVPGIKTYQQTTGIDGANHTLELFRQAKARRIRTCANITVSRTNLPELYENIAYPLINGANYVLINRFMPGGRGMSHQDLLLNGEELNELFDTAEEVLARAGKKGYIGTELPYCAIKNPKIYRYLSIASTCSAAKHFCALDPNGYLKVCNHSPTTLCRWDEIPNVIPQHPYWQRFIKSDYIPAICAGCKDLSHCHGGCREAAHVFGGDVASPDPLLQIEPYLKDRRK